MKILFIAGQAIKSNSSVTMMNVAYIQGLVETGNYVKVITSRLPENHIAQDNGFELPKEVDIEEYSISPTFDALSNKKVKNHKFKSVKNLLRKIYNNFSIYGTQKAWVNNVERFSDEEYYDLIISSSDPKHSHLFAKYLIEKGKVRYGKWVQLWGDPMYLDITRKRNLLNHRLYKEEENLISSADKIIYVSPFTAEKQKELFPQQRNKIDYILIPYFSIDNHLSNNIERNKMTFGYFGDYHSEVRNLDPLYDAALETGVNMVVRGNSDNPAKSINKINIGSRIPIKELNEIEKNTDVFVHLCNLTGTQIPAKVYYYSGTTKPILFILDGDSAKIKEFYSKYNRYVFCENNKEDIIKAINKIRNNDYPKEMMRVVDELSPAFIVKDLLLKVEAMSK